MTRSAIVRAGAVLAVLAAFTAAAMARAQSAALQRIAEVLELSAGDVVADVGAGDGEWSLGLAQIVGPDGRVYATEISERLVRRIEQSVASAGARNVTVIAGGERSTGLPDACCDAILLRFVYHHFDDPDAMNAGLLAALKPGGLLALIDFEPNSSRGAGRGRRAHGIEPPEVVGETSASGFEVVRVIEDWDGVPGRFCVLLRKPLRAG